MYVIQRFDLDHRATDYLQSLRPQFGYNGFGELVYYRTYSRKRRSDGAQEQWADTVIRVTEGTFSIRKDFYIKNRIPWDEQYWQAYARAFAVSMFQMKWLPPGRGLWAMGSDFVYERGAMALYNCAYTNIGFQELSDDLGWLMDSLMHGVGVGFGPLRDDLKFTGTTSEHFDFIIPDSREGWVEAVQHEVASHQFGGKIPHFIFDEVRPAGLPIKGFGGISSGPEPLQELLESIREHSHLFLQREIDVVEYKTNCANLIGKCVVAGNVRRSAEIACGSVHDKTFLDLKDYKKKPYRAPFGWMSNNSVMMDSDQDFDHLGEVAQRVITNGEPGVINRRNLRFGRFGKNDGSRPDHAIGFNPCGEIPLEHREVCNLSETLPTMCDGVDDWYKACEHATFYSSTVSLLPTHQPSTNRVVARNRRIGVGIIDFSGWKHRHGVHKVTKYLRAGYKVVCERNKQLNAEAGVPEALRKTCVKPGGTTPKLPGKTPGMGHPTFIHTLRRINIAQNSPIHPLLVVAGIPFEASLSSSNTDVFEYPIIQGPARAATEVSLWEQANDLVLLQREWADNAVSNTLYFKPKWKLIQHEWKCVELILDREIGYNARKNLETTRTTCYVIPYRLRIELQFNDERITEMKIYEYDPAHEEDHIEPVLSSTVPVCKSLSLLPHTPEGVYKQMPEEGISEAEYHLRYQQIQRPDWSQLQGSDGEDERYCTGPSCEIPQIKE